MKKIVEDRAREKRENQLAKERIKAQIEQDRKDRGESEASMPGVPRSAPMNSSSSSTIVKEYKETKIQVRQLDGKPIIQSFNVKEPLSAVRLYVQLNRKDEPGVAPKLMS